MSDNLSAPEFFWEEACNHLGRDIIEGSFVIELHGKTPFPDLEGMGAILISMDFNSELTMEVYEQLDQALLALRERHRARVLH